jgi:hypothetical protein
VSRVTTKQTIAEYAETSRSLVWRIFPWSFYVMLLIAGVISIPSLKRGGVLPATVMLDTWLILFLVVTIFTKRIFTTGTIALVALYALTRVAPAVYNGSPTEDFLQAYRWLLYLIVIAVAVGQRWPSIRPLIGFTWAIIGLSLIKAALGYLIVGPSARTGLLLENNFELAMYAGLVVIVYRHVRPAWRIWLLALFGATTLLSESRSGIIAFAIVAVYAFTQVPSKRLVLQYVFACALFAVGAVVLSVFNERANASSYAVDRLNFFEKFQNETSSWNVLDWAIGSTPITPLSPATCAELNAYDRLYSSTGDGSCYSVILHAFLMRVVFDAGIIGLLLAFGVIIYLMYRAGVEWRIAAALLLIAVSNSFSVSGPNNPYVIVPVLLAILTRWIPVPSFDEERGGSRRTSPGTTQEAAEPSTGEQANVGVIAPRR